MIGVARKALDFYRNFNNIQNSRVLAYKMQKNPENDSWGSFDMIFFGITFVLFMALAVIAGWAFYKIHSNQFS